MWRFISNSGRIALISATVVACYGRAGAQVALQHFEGDPNGNVANQFGYTVAVVGDVDGDAVPDVLVGAPYHATGNCSGNLQYEFGYASLLSGQSGALIKKHVGKSYGCAPFYYTPAGGSRLGIAVAGVGDVDSDGVADYAIGSDRDNLAGTDSGSVTVYSGATQVALFTSKGVAAYDYFGRKVRAVGDFDADGVPDFAVTSPGADFAGKTDCGSVTVISGAPPGQKLHTIYGTSTAANMNFCDRVGDVNFDGYDDVLVGAPLENTSNLLKNGRVSVISGQAPHASLLVFEGAANNEALGNRVAGGGDLNHDGLPDLLYLSSGVSPRVVHVVDTFGGPILDIPAPAGSVAFGDTLAGAGDVDGDGWGDFLIGDWNHSGGAGVVYVYSIPNGVLTTIATLPVSTEAGGNFGVSLDSVGHWDSATMGWKDGDWNGDGTDDLVVGAPHEYFNRGRAWIYTPICLDAETFCTSTVNSSGQAATIGFQGSLSVALNDLVLTAQGLPPKKPGLFYFGPLQIQVPFGCGYRCVGGTTSRLPVHFTTTAGTVSHAVDYATPPATAIQAGETWHFQFWFRDPTGCAAGFNFSDGLTGTFCP